MMPALFGALEQRVHASHRVAAHVLGIVVRVGRTFAGQDAWMRFDQLRTNVQRTVRRSARTRTTFPMYRAGSE
jgi:hypothetical protein